MSKIRETVISNCEKKFMVKCLSEFQRLDGRAFDEFRDLNIEFGKDWGCCYVSLGETRVLAQVSCEVQQPKSSRPSEGLLNINLELNPLGAPYFEAGRQSELSVQLNRLLEKCLKDSKVVDLESLCIKVNEKVWAFKIDINVLNHEGNILDAASIASLCALAHFRRPDVTCDGEEIIIHTYKQRDPIPTVIHHYPIYITFVIFNNGEVVLADPTLLEESVAEAHLTISLNAYKEVCGLHLGGSALISTDLILMKTTKAATRAIGVIKQIKQHIQKDSNDRLEKQDIGFHHSLHAGDDKFQWAQDNLTTCLDRWSIAQKGKKKYAKKECEMELDVTDKPEGTVDSFGQGYAALVPKEDGDQQNKWRLSSDEESELEETDLNEPEPLKKQQETVIAYDNSVEELIYKDLLNYNVIINGVKYPLIQQLEGSRYCLVCENGIGGQPSKHVKCYYHIKQLKLPQILNKIKLFHDIWMHQPPHIQRQQMYFRKRKKKITCTVCSNYVLYNRYSLEDHVGAERHQMFLARKIEQFKYCHNVKAGSSDSMQLINDTDCMPEVPEVLSSGSEEDNVVVLNVDKQTSKKKRKFSN